MREEDDVTKRMERYRKELLEAVTEKERLGRQCSGELDLRILSLIHKLEILFWVLEIELPKNKINILH
jgi:hypothetical protein